MGKRTDVPMYRYTGVPVKKRIIAGTLESYNHKKEYTIGRHTLFMILKNYFNT